MFYPVDNSFAEPRDGNLAGTSEMEAKLVKIVSGPYIRDYVSLSGISKGKDEFVDVEYEGQKHSVLNHFSETQPYPIDENEN